MGRRAKQRNPLGPRASRVEKELKSRHELPAWFERVKDLRWGKPPFHFDDPADFDEDLSELEEESDDDSEDNESEQSYYGSDAEFYYSWKEERKQRKRRLKAEEEYELRKDQQLEYERAQEEGVRAEWRSTRNAQGKVTAARPVESLAGREFQLFCSDHINHFCKSGVRAMKRVKFIHPDDMDGDSDDPDEKSGDDAGLMYGMLDLDGYASCKFGPFFPPSMTTGRPVRVESCDGEHKLLLDFIDNDYLKLRVSRKLVFMNTSASPANPPHRPRSQSL